MNLMDLLQQAGARGSVDELAGSVGIPAAKVQDLIGALSPALVGGLKKQARSSGGLEALGKALTTGGHQRYVERPDLMAKAATRDDGNKILGHLFGSKDVSRQVAARAAEQTGLDSGLIKKALPLVADLAMGALSKKSAAAGPAPSAEGLGGLLGGLMGGGDDDGLGIDDLLGLAKKLF